MVRSCIALFWLAVLMCSCGGCKAAEHEANDGLSMGEISENPPLAWFGNAGR